MEAQGYENGLTCRAESWRRARAERLPVTLGPQLAQFDDVDWNLEAVVDVLNCKPTPAVPA